ncbi:MAG: G5 domain-containing protein [Anaerolineales bacterium]|nr:G5 domain-containing protein [Anaerolineales bacterium]
MRWIRRSIATFAWPAGVRRLVACLGFAALFASACRPLSAPPAATAAAVTISIQVDGDVAAYALPPGLTVREAVAHAGITLGELDRLTPPAFTIIADGAAVVITRITETFETEQVVLPYSSEIVHNSSQPGGERRLLQVGQTGLEELTYRTVFEDGIQVSRSIVRRVIVTNPVPEIIMVGTQGSFTLVPISGTLAYISGRNAWVMRENTGQRLPLTTAGDLDGRVFDLSPDGQWLLFTREVTQASSQNFNTLWAVSTLPITATRTTPLPFSLPISNVLYAEWSPLQPRTFVYSTAERIPRAPGRQANNDLWLVQWSQSASRRLTITTTQLLDTSAGGLYGWWGTGFAFAPDGRTLAYARADSVGLLTYQLGRRSITATVTMTEVAQFTPYNTHGDWAWYPPLRWAPGGILYTIAHGPPIGLEAPEDSPAFDLAALTMPGGLQFKLIPRAGMFANPMPSPPIITARGETSYRVAFLQATDPNNSPFSTYRLGLMDRDGSNAHHLFPPEGQAGLSANEVVAWSPDGQLIAVVYQGNLWLLDPDTGLNQQITGDGLSAQPRWAR